MALLIWLATIITLLALKLTETVDWSWWIIFIPLYVAVMWFIFIAICIWWFVNNLDNKGV